MNLINPYEALGKKALRSLPPGFGPNTGEPFMSPEEDWAPGTAPVLRGIRVLDAPLEALTASDFEQILDAMALRRNNIEGEIEFMEEIEADEETHHCLNAWVHHLRCPPSRRDSFVWRLVTSASSVTVADLHHAYAQAVDPHQGMGISPYPFWQSDLRHMLAEKAEEFFCRNLRVQGPSRGTFLGEAACS